MSETVKQILITIGTFLGSISVSSIFNAIYNAIRFARLKKWIEKNNNQETAKATGEKAVLDTVEQIKNISFKQSIEPIAKAELQKITEQANAYIEQAMAETQKRYDKLVKVIESLAAYFDNSIGVSEEAKERLKQAIKEAEIEPTTDNTIEVEEIVVEPKNEPAKAKSNVKVSR